MLCSLSGLESETQRKQKDRYMLRRCQRTKKAVEHEDDGDIIVTLPTVPKSLENGQKELKNRGRNETTQNTV